MNTHLPVFYDNPSVAGLDDAPDAGSFVMRVGFLVGRGIITLEQAQELLTIRGVQTAFGRPSSAMQREAPR